MNDAFDSYSEYEETVYGLAGLAVVVVAFLLGFLAGRWTA